jgi:hypothetical protein
MADFNTMRVIPFCGKGDEWPFWIEKFLAKAKRYGFKDSFLGKLSIPKAIEKFDEVSAIVKKMARTIKLNEIVYTLSVDAKASMTRLRLTLSKGVKARSNLIEMQ